MARVTGSPNAAHKVYALSFGVIALVCLVAAIVSRLRA
jgi:hypothetical protein